MFMIYDVVIQAWSMRVVGNKLCKTLTEVNASQDVPNISHSTKFKQPPMMYLTLAPDMPFTASMIGLVISGGWG